MKIKLISDIHCEFHVDGGVSWANTLDNAQVDALIIAGDLGTASCIVQVLNIFCNRFPHVIYATGNHEHYYSSFNEVRTLLNEIKHEYNNFHYLDNTIASINGQRFLGATLWFRDDPLNIVYRECMPDFRVIKNFETHVYKENAKTIKFLTNNVRAGDIVVTHHVPSYRSVNQRFSSSNLNRFFVCDMTDIIMNNKPAYWLHGHTHNVYDYVINNTRILCNPLGYMHEFTNFNDNFLLEI